MREPEYSQVLMMLYTKKKACNQPSKKTIFENTAVK
jgi:hypothetical protein